MMRPTTIVFFVILILVVIGHIWLANTMLHLRLF